MTTSHPALPVSPNPLAPAQAIKLHYSPLSGHNHRVQLFLSLLGLPVELIYVDLVNKAQKTPQFLTKNPFGQVPVLEDGALILSDSNAMLVYLAAKYGNSQWLPQEPVAAANVQRWLSLAAGLLAFGPARARMVTVFKAPFDAADAIARAETLFAVMEQTLQITPFLTGEMATIADIANYAYTARAPEGNISLAPYPHIRAWLTRIESLPGFIPMAKTAADLQT